MSIYTSPYTWMLPAAHAQSAREINAEAPGSAKEADLTPAGYPYSQDNETASDEQEKARE